MSEITKNYILKFGSLPFLIVPLNYNDFLYQELMKKAIEKNKELTKEEIIKAFSNENYDLNKS